MSPFYRYLRGDRHVHDIDLIIIMKNGGDKYPFHEVDT